MAWRASQKEIRAEDRLLNEDLYQKARPIVSGYIERLQRAERPEDFFQLHLDVLKEFAARQIAAGDTLSTHRAGANKQIKRLAAMKPKPLRELEEANEFLDRVKRQERVVRALQHALRVVADGIAWRALDYNRAAISVLGRGERVGHVASGAGFEAEIAALGRFWEEEHLFAIHNDITNCLRHGDLTIVDLGQPKKVNVGEVKVSNLGSAREQLRRMEEAIGLLNTGVYPNAPADLPTRILQVRAPFQTYLDELRRLVAEARLTRFAWARPHDAITLGAVYYGRPDVDGHAERELDQMRRTLGWNDPSRGFSWAGAQRRMRDRSFTPPQFAPLSIYPLPSTDVADLILGFVDTIVYLDIAKLEQAFRARGLAATVARSAEPFLEVSVGPYKIIVPGYLREMTMNELMTPDSLVAAVETMLAFAREKDTSRDRVLLVFLDESSAWAAARRPNS